jgi:predicted transcriptional regulator
LDIIEKVRNEEIFQEIRQERESYRELKLTGTMTSVLPEQDPKKTVDEIEELK